MEQPKIYLETTICSYLAAWPSRDLISAARQQITHEWWKKQRERFQLFASEYVWTEASRGDDDAAQRRLSYLSDVILLSRSDEAVVMAERLQAEVPLPARAATLREPIGEVCRSQGFEPPIICTPEELLGKERANEA